jgi:hypothetical protein
MNPHTPPETFPPIRIVWPPPGLENSQGAFGRAARRVGFGGFLLALPQLASVTVPQSFNSLGLLGAGWWVVGISSLLGFMVVVQGLADLFGFFRNAGKASAYGIDLETVLQVGADGDGDMGSLIQGTRSYRSLDEESRIRAARARIWASLLFLSAALWISAGWALSFFLASWGLLGPKAVWLLALGPAGITSLAGVVARSVEGSALNRAIGPVLWNRWKTVGQREAARIWGEELGRFRAGRGERVVSGKGAFLAGALSVVALGIGVSIPALGFSAATAVGPTLASIAIPKFSATMRKAGEAEALKYLRLDSDPSISPDAAGEALHVLASMGARNRNDEAMKSPPRTYDEWFLPGGTENPMGLKPHVWPVELIPTVLEGLSPEGEAYLREISRHPALAEFETLAHAQAADFLGARFLLPLPADMTPMSFPIPRLSGLREGGYAMVAKAAVELLDGRPEEAERTLRTLLSTGALMAEESPTLIGSLIGFVLVFNGADGLEALYGATGREEEAQSIRRIRAATRKASEMAQQGTFGGGSDAALRGFSRTVISEEAVRGLRWEFLFTLTGLNPCINPNRVLFGPGEEWAGFLRSAENGLVRYPAEQALFDLFKKGWFDSRGQDGTGSSAGRFVKATLGGGAGRCAEILTSGIF